MSETRATSPNGSAPVFPPGRYGRRRSGHRSRVVPIVLLTTVLGACVLLSVRLYHQYGRTDYQAQIVGWDQVTDAQLTVRFTVRVPAGMAASCLLRARDYAGMDVGRREVVVRPAANGTRIEAAEPVPTRARAAVGEVLSCRPAG